jgi:site-specific recombinase XerD
MSDVCPSHTPRQPSGSRLLCRWKVRERSAGRPDVFPTCFRWASINVSHNGRGEVECTREDIWQIVQGYRGRAGMSQPIHPHLFRHQMNLVL